MSAQEEARAATIVREAMSLPLEERAAYIDQACANDDSLRAHVDTLSGETEFDETSSGPRKPSTRINADLPQRVGPYQLLERIGAGGFGEVFLAQQTAPVRRKVAFKVLLAERNTDGILRRFEAERQLLAKMDHPGIARIFDAGETPSGRPFFAMEMVNGSPIADHCDTNQLGIRDRIRLAASACRAVQHAHQKGIIHRDLKSSNVLVTTVDGEPMPKVIDFGIAKASDESLADSADQTRQGEMIGTPAYMSPEQLGGLDVDTRTDVYSMGVLIYQLLTGTLPFSPDNLRGSGLLEFHRRVIDEDAPRPSDRLAALRDNANSIAAERDTTVTQLIREVRGELDWIVLRALEKDREHRYDSASDLADDLERYLADRPVLAHPPTTGYTLAKFARRNKALVVGALATTIALLAGIVGSTTFALRETQQRKQAEAARADLETVVAFQDEMLQRINPSQMGGLLFRDLRDRHLAATEDADDQGLQVEGLRRALRQVNATDLAVGLLDQTIIEAAANSIENEFSSQPRVAAQLSQTLGATAVRLSLYDRAEGLFRAALADLQGLGTEAELRRLDLQRDLGGLYIFMGRYDDAKVELADARASVARLEVPDEQLLDLRSAEALLLREQQEWVEATKAYTSLVEERSQRQGRDHIATLSDMDGLGWSLLQQLKHAEAESLQVETLERARKELGPEHEVTLAALNNLAVNYVLQGRYELAEPLYKEELEISRRQFGSEHRETHVSITNLARFYIRQEKFESAMPHVREALDVGSRILPSNSFGLGIGFHSLGEVMLGLSRPQEAEEPLLKAWTIFDDLFDDDRHPGKIRVAADLAKAYSQLDQPERAAQWEGTHSTLSRPEPNFTLPAQICAESNPFGV